MSVTLKSRLPEIENALPIALGRVVYNNVQAIANDAQAAVPVATGTLRDSIEARVGDSKLGGHQSYGIWAAWYWFFSEYGTVRTPAQPWLTPAAERRRAVLIAEAKAALKRL